LTQTANGNVTFVLDNPMTGVAALVFIPPWEDDVEFDELLPNLGFSFRPWDRHQFYVSYAEGLSAPRTDNLYTVGRDPGETELSHPTPESEMTKSIDVGWRLNHPTNIASLALYQIAYTDRIVSTFDADKGYSEDRNVGDVDILGFDAQFGHRFGDLVSLTLGASYNDSELKGSLDPSLNGKKLVETPEWTYSAHLDFDVTDDLRFGLQAKKVDERFGTDNNRPDDIAPAYTVVDVDLNYRFTVPGFESAELQFNVTNLLDEEYFGNISSGTGVGTSVAFYSIGAPRTVVGSIRFNF
jgi:iron complex outermembrane receptor protein